MLRVRSTTAQTDFLNPFTIFGGGFCCDQVTLYEAGRDRQWWLLQYGDHLTLANSSGTDLFTNWCYYNFSPTDIGLAADAEFDYNDLSISNNFIYITTNLFGSASGAAIIRLPMDSMITCGGFGYNYIVRSESFTFKPVQGATDVMYWGSNWTELPLGTSFRVFSWAENSGSYSWYDRTIDAFTFMFRNGGQNCASESGVVRNWCEFADSRVLGGYRANGVVGFSFNASQGSGYPFPYTRRVYFKESDISYLGSSSFWGSWGALLFLSLTPNARGHIGGTFAWGGGTGPGNFYPGTGIFIEDDIAPAQPWSYDYYLWGQGNTCQFNDNGTLLYRWGDYLTVRPFAPASDVWAAAGYAVKGADCGSRDTFGNPLWRSEPHYVVFGRERERGSYERWKSK